MYEVMVGYIRKADTSNNQILDIYPLAELLLNARLRYQLKNELEANPALRLFCGCSPENNRPIFINANNSLHFPENIGHAALCVSYIKDFSKYLSIPLIKILTAPNPCLPVSFSWGFRSRSTYAMVTNGRLSFLDSPTDRISLEDFVKYINYSAFYKRAMDILHGRQNTYPESMIFLEDIMFEFGKFCLQNSERMTINTNTCFRKNQPIGTVGFLYAKVSAINRSYKTNVYITAQCINGAATFELAHEKWSLLEPDIDEDLPLYICAIIRTEEAHSFSYGKRDSITHTFQGKTSNKRERHHILSFVLFHANKYGLLCCNKEEYIKTNSLCSQGEVCFVPYFPEIPTS